MVNLRCSKTSAQLPVDADEEIDIEGCGDARRIIICSKKPSAILHKVDAEKQKAPATEQAMQRLESSDSSILMIALECGFKGSQSFSRAFKRTVGCSPSEYKRLHHI